LKIYANKKWWGFKKLRKEFSMSKTRNNRDNKIIANNRDLTWDFG